MLSFEHSLKKQTDMEDPFGYRSSPDSGLHGRPTAPPGDADYHDPAGGSGDEELPTVVSVARRNERERKRVRLVNQGFAVLRDRVPRDRCGRGRRASKVETLRAAILYIRQLQQLLLESRHRLAPPLYAGEDAFFRPHHHQGGAYFGDPFGGAESPFTLQSTTCEAFGTDGGVAYVSDERLGVPWFA